MDDTSIHFAIEKKQEQKALLLLTQELFSDFCKVFKSTYKLCSV